MRTLRATLLALAAALPGAAAAQLATEPLVVPLPDGTAEVAAGALGALPGDDLLLYVPGGAGSVLVPARHLLELADPPVRALDGAGADVAAGRLFQATPAGKADLVFVRPTGLSVSAAASPLVLDTYALVGGGEETVAVATLLAGSPQLVVVPTGVGAGTPGNLRLWDLTGPPEGQVVPIPALTGRLAFHTEVFPVRLGAAALAAGVDDLAVPGTGAVVLAVQRPGANDVGSLDFETLRVGDAVPQASATWLPAGVRQGDVLGVASLDVDVDGTPDLVLTLNLWTPPALWQDGALLWVKGTGTPADFATASWSNLGARPELGLLDPAVLRPVDLGAFRGAAVWDRRGDALVVLWTEPGSSTLRVWRAGARGLAIREIVAANVVGSAAPDLVAVGFDWATGQGALLVFADAADAPPTLAWADGSPGTARRGADHGVTVVATDPQGPVALAWTVGGAPQPASGATLTLPGASLCGAGPIAVAVRGTDTGGQWRDLAGAVAIAAGAPEFSIAEGGGATLALAPGGTSLALQGSIWEACGGAPAFTPGGTGLPAGATWEAVPSGTSVALTLGLPEATYAALLAVPGAPTVTLSATGPGGLASDVASIPLALDATGLVALTQASDVASLGEGGLAVLTTEVRSRIAAPLGGVTVRLALAGLEPAGPATVLGAAKAGEARVEGGLEVALDALPGSGSAVVVQVPVRGTGARAAASADARSAGGHALTRPAAAVKSGGRLPGCGCGSGGGGGTTLLFVLLAFMSAHRERTSPNTAHGERPSTSAHGAAHRGAYAQDERVEVEP